MTMAPRDVNTINQQPGAKKKKGRSKTYNSISMVVLTGSARTGVGASPPCSGAVQESFRRFFIHLIILHLNTEPLQEGTILCPGQILTN